MRLAKKEVGSQRKLRSMEFSSSSMLMAQLSGVRALAALLIRHRQTRAVMWRVFEHAVLGWYEHAASHFGVGQLGGQLGASYRPPGPNDHELATRGDSWEDSWA